MASTKRLEDYLAKDEELLLSFTAVEVTQGTSEDDEQSFSDMLETQTADATYIFGATDRRIVYLLDSGGFKDIDYEHISSIEADIEEEDDTDPRGGIGICGGLLLLAGLGGISDNPGFGIFLLLVGAGLIAGAVYMDHEEEIKKRQQIKFITGDEAHQQLQVTVSSDASAELGAELSQILREQR